MKPERNPNNFFAAFKIYAGFIKRYGMLLSRLEYRRKDVECSYPDCEIAIKLVRLPSGL